LQLNPESLAEFDPRKGAGARKNFEILQAFAARRPSGRHRRIHFRFLLSPLELQGDWHVERVLLERNRLVGPPFEQGARGTGERTELDAGLVFRSIGYKGTALDGVPFDAQQGTFPTKEGRIVDEAGVVMPGLYASGWIKRGPTGIIGTNRADSVETVESLLADLETLDPGPRPGADALDRLRAGPRVVSYEDWLAIDQAEIGRGQAGREVQDPGGAAAHLDRDEELVDHPSGQRMERRPGHSVGVRQRHRHAGVGAGGHVRLEGDLRHEG